MLHFFYSLGIIFSIIIGASLLILFVTLIAFISDYISDYKDFKVYRRRLNRLDDSDSYNPFNY